MRIVRSVFVRIKKYIFNGINVNIPEKPEEVLRNLYGETWRIPNKKYKYWENPQAIKIKQKGKTKIFNK